MSGSSLPITCDHAERRALLREHPHAQGIDYVRVVQNQRMLEVHFIEKETQEGRSNLEALLDALAQNPRAVTIEGGTRIPDVGIEAVRRVGRHLEIEVDHPGDFSPYTLRLTEPSRSGSGGAGEDFVIDPPFAACEFGFKAACPSRFDCRPREVAPPEEREAPAIDYMAKDYASFRRALLDLASQSAPDWEERKEADVGIALVELLAHAGDELSYFQDAVANEAYLETARQRISVRRHARLIDYPMHDGLSARTFLQFKVGDSPKPQIVPPGTPVFPPLPGQLRDEPLPHGPVLPPRLRPLAEEEAEAVFETFTYHRRHQDVVPEEDDEVQGVPVDDRLNKIIIHPWGNDECFLPAGSTSADLEGDLHYDPADGNGADRDEAWRLRPGDLLLLEEIRDPETGLRADADPSHRQVVRVTGTERLDDPVTEKTLTRVHWHEEDALDFSLCVRTSGPADRTSGPEGAFQAGVARGNLVPADHGTTVEARHPPVAGASGRGEGIELGDAPYRFGLDEGPLSHRLPVGDAAPVSSLRPVSREDLRQSRPQVRIREVVKREGEEATCEGTPWTPVDSLLEASGPFDHHVVPETNNDGRATLRFGNGEYGRPPREGARFCVRYRVGIGRSGNVGADSLQHVVAPEEGFEFWPNIKDVRNPVPAWGGVEPESIAEVKEKAPEAFHARQFRAVTEEDYRRVAEEHPRVSGARATFRWTGSWHTVFIAIDPVGQTGFDASLEESVIEWVDRFRMAGYDLEVSEPVYVPLEIKLRICAAPGHFRAHVREAVRDALGSGRRADGSLGFFHPDRFTFGEALYESQLYAAVERVPGVESATLTRFEPLYREAAGELEEGVIRAGRTEVLRLDNDPSHPEHGVLELEMKGGK